LEKTLGWLLLLADLSFYTLDVFTDTLFGGNPLAVVFGAESLGADRMQAVAAEFNLSETVFVLPPVRHTSTRRIRIFTPRAELPFAGHPTIGTAWLLAALGEYETADNGPRVILEEAVGDVEVTVKMSADQPVAATMTVPVTPARLSFSHEATQLAPMLALEPGDFRPDYEPCIYSCGTPFVFVCLNSADAVRCAQMRVEVSERLLAGAEANMVFVFAFETESPHAQIHARMFAPAMGVPEDPATGGAVSALAGLLAARHQDGKRVWVVEQGIEMGRPSYLTLEYECRDGQAHPVRVGGSCVRVSKGTLAL
jgi:trans-2,3-dihydro-3-hydroxyanthranilate isomerase